MKNVLFYVLTIGGLAAVVSMIIWKGGSLEEVNVAVTQAPQVEASTWKQFLETAYHNITHPLALLLFQIITIIISARVLGFFFRKIGQPAVIGEIVAGILLGPSLLGMVLPDVSAAIFPKESLSNLQFLSQIGLILFMFVVGMELDLNVLKKKANEAVIISHASIVFPFALGVGLAYFVYQSFAPEGIQFLSFALFMGIAMSVTAFPVLARIVQERGLAKTKLGAIVITCAAADDITAWCILAAVIAIVKAGSVWSAFYIIFIAVIYVIVMLKVIAPFLQRIGNKYADKESLSRPVVAIFFITLLISSYLTEIIGIHALFGAFLAGVIMPNNLHFRNIFIEKVEDVALVLLLPLFFVFTGLRTHIGLLSEVHLLITTGLIVLVAITGKFFGSALAARFVGQSWRDSWIIGALMNTRGLMELVVLNIGYDLGVLSDEIFAMLVIMALVTTFMTGPLLDLIDWLMPDPEKKKELINESIQSKFGILVAFGSPDRGKTLLRLAHSFTKKAPDNAVITALHVSPSTDLNQFNLDEYEMESFKPIRAEAKKLNRSVTSLFKPTVDIDKAITDTANAGQFDLLMIGIGRSVFDGTILGKVLGFTSKLINPERLYETIIGKERLFEHTVFDDRTRQLIKSSRIPVGIMVDKELESIQRVIVPIFSVSDSFLLLYAQKLIHHNESQVQIHDVMGITKQYPEMKENIRSIELVAPSHISLVEDAKIEEQSFDQFDLVLISFESWKKAVDEQSAWLSATPSMLIIRP